MLTVADYELIRRKFFVDGQSARAIAKELGHSRKTVAKAIASAVPPGYRRSEPRERPAIERYRTIIDAWLEEDQSRPRKQRHTAQRIYERLRDDHEYTGSPSALSQLNFGIDRLEFTAGIVDFHLPIDAALSFVDVV